MPVKHGAELAIRMSQGEEYMRGSHAHIHASSYIVHGFSLVVLKLEVLYENCETRNYSYISWFEFFIYTLKVFIVNI